MGIFEHYQQRYEAHREEEYSIQEYLELCKEDKSVYANAAERLLQAIGEPRLIDTSQTPTLSVHTVASDKNLGTFACCLRDFSFATKSKEQRGLQRLPHILHRALCHPFLDVSLSRMTTSFR